MTNHDPQEFDAYLEAVLDRVLDAHYDRRSARYRDAVRAILVAAGAPDEDLDALVASGMSLAEAHGYRAPPRDAWCPRCDGPVADDGRGCITCRREDQHA